MLLCCVLVASGRPARATTLAERVGKNFAAISDTFAKTVGRSLPIIAASAGVRFRFDPALGTFERERSLAGQLYMESAEPLGKAHWNVSVTYQRVHLDEFDGHPLDDLSDRRPVVHSDGTPLFTLPHTSIDVEAQEVSTSVTYGLTDDLDVNLTVPVVYTALERTDDVVLLFPDAPPDGQSHDAASKTGVGDVLVRGKLRLLARSPFSLAGGLTLRLPSGSADDFHGTGDVELVPMLYASSARWSPLRWLTIRGHLNAGMSFDASDVNQSEARWATGLDADFGSRVTAALGFLGRDAISRIAAPGAFDAPRCLDPISVCQRDPSGSRKGSLPIFGFRGGRPDYVNLSIGGRVFLWRDTLIGVANVLLPLTDQGLRTGPIPLVGLEAAF